ncbi:small lysine-rich protein 1 [Amia ocellicauda]|uniref:small lysine-rich protein 1 n=1 Tax=Amia ocellicauda TaxID=2972642 RepID=UPI0034639AE9
MPTKNKKQKSHSADKRKKGKGKKPSKKRSASAKSAKREVDILSPAAMENVYYISHNAVDCLEFRGFGWPESAKKKGKKGKMGKKVKGKK